MQPVQLNPYISFKDNAKQAMEFYQSVFGGELESHTFKEYNASQDATEDNKIMHSMLTADGVVFMAADTPNAMEYNDGARISMSLSGTDMDKLSGYYKKLSEGGQQTLPLEKAPWGDHFGMVVDKFGVCWMVNIHEQEA